MCFFQQALLKGHLLCVITVTIFSPVKIIGIGDIIINYFK